MGDENKRDIDWWFTYHAPHGDQLERYQKIRESARQFAEVIDDLTPFSRESSTAMQHLRTAVMWANASIAINESGDS
jgi:hypothetical protein